MPTPRDVHVDAPLTNALIGYRNTRFVADEVFPIVGVQKRSDIVPAYDQSPWFRRPGKQAVLRGPGSRSKRGSFTVNTDDTYYCHRYSFGVELDDDTRDNADSVWRMEERSSQLAMDMVYLERELALASEIFTTSVWGDDETGGADFTVFSNYSTSQPLVVLSGYQDEVEGRVALEANAVLMGKQVWQQMKWHPDILDSIKYTERGIVTEDIFKSLTGFSKVLIGRALYTTDPEGTAEASVTYSRIWGKNMLVFYVADSPSLMDPSAGYTFTWERVASSLQYIVRHRDDEAEKDIFEANSYFDHKVTVPNAGTFLSGAVS